MSPDERVVKGLIGKTINRMDFSDEDNVIVMGFQYDKETPEKDVIGLILRANDEGKLATTCIVKPSEEALRTGRFLAEKYGWVKE